MNPYHSLCDGYAQQTVSTLWFVSLSRGLLDPFVCRVARVGVRCARLEGISLCGIPRPHAEGGSPCGVIRQNPPPPRGGMSPSIMRAIAWTQVSPSTAKREADGDVGGRVFGPSSRSPRSGRCPPPALAPPAGWFAPGSTLVGIGHRELFIMAPYVAPRVVVRRRVLYRRTLSSYSLRMTPPPPLWGRGRWLQSACFCGGKWDTLASGLAS